MSGPNFSQFTLGRVSGTAAQQRINKVSSGTVTITAADIRDGGFLDGTLDVNLVDPQAPQNRAHFQSKFHARFAQ